MYSNTSLYFHFVPSVTFMPKRAAKNDKGRKMIVITVKSMIARPCRRVTSPCLTASRASTTEACCCFRLSRSLSLRRSVYTCKMVMKYHNYLHLTKHFRQLL